MIGLLFISVIIYASFVNRDHVSNPKSVGNLFGENVDGLGHTGYFLHIINI